jgi:hypothetical protein
VERISSCWDIFFVLFGALTLFRSFFFLFHDLGTKERGACRLKAEGRLRCMDGTLIQSMLHRGGGYMG